MIRAIRWIFRCDRCGAHELFGGDAGPATREAFARGWRVLKKLDDLSTSQDVCPACMARLDGGKPS